MARIYTKEHKMKKKRWTKTVEGIQHKKKAQIWFLDFMAGLFIFIVVIVFYYDYYENIGDESDSSWNEMVVDSKTIASSLMSVGYPLDWTGGNVQRVGLTNGNSRLNDTKLDEFSKIEYNTSQKIFATRFQYYFFIEDKNNNPYFQTGKIPENETRLVQATRLAIYNSSIYRMVIYIWE